MYTLENMIDILKYEESPVKQRKRFEILTKAQSILTREGIYPVKMSDIAEEIGISKRSLYYYYKNKEELAVDVQIMVMSEYINGREPKIDESLTGYEQLCQLADFMIDRIEYYHKEIKYITAFDYYFYNGYPDKKYTEFLRTIDEDLTMSHIFEKGLVDGSLSMPTEDYETLAMTIYQTVFAYSQKMIYREKSMLSEEPDRKVDLKSYFDMMKASMRA